MVTVGNPVNYHDIVVSLKCILLLQSLVCLCDVRLWFAFNVFLVSLLLLFFRSIILYRSVQHNALHFFVVFKSHI